MMKKSIFGEKIKIIMVVCALLSTGSLPVLQDSYESYATSVTLSQKQIMLTDIKGHWAEQVIQKLVSEKAIAGYPDGSYRPNKSITNAELASIIAGAVKLAPKEKKNTHWASGVFEALYDKGIQAVDYPEKDYDRAINRYQMIKLLILVNENIQSHPSVEASDAKGAIADYASIPESYKYYVEQAVKKGFIRGDQYQRINGSSTTTRAEAAVIIDKLKTAKAGQTVTPTPVPQQPTPAPNQPQQPQVSNPEGYAPKPAGYDQMTLMQKTNARKNKKIGWIYYDAQGVLDTSKLKATTKADFQPSKEAFEMVADIIRISQSDLYGGVQFKDDNSCSFMAWDKAQQQFGLTITRIDAEDDAYSIRANSNAGFEVTGMGLIGSDGLGDNVNSNETNALVNPKDRNDGYVNVPTAPVIKNKNDNPKYIVIYGSFAGEHKVLQFVVKTQGLKDIIWENDLG